MSAHRQPCESNPKRADWLFLLPRPPAGKYQHLVVLGGPAGVAKRIGDVGIARQVGDRLPDTGSVDALAILVDSPVSLAQAVTRLATGGVLYYEVSRRSPGNRMATPNRVFNSLKRFGVISAGLYLVTPNFMDYRQYVPLYMDGAFKWYLTERYAPLSARQSVTGLASRALTRMSSRRLGSIAPNYAVIAVNGAPGDYSPAILGHATVQREYRAAQTQPVLLTNGIDDGSRVVLLPFASDSSHPEMVLKVSRRSVANVAIEREQQTLQEIRSGVSSSMQRSIPRPLGVFAHGKLSVGMESFVHGRSLMVLGWQWRRPMREKVEDLQLVTDWLSRFHQQLRPVKAAWGKDDLLLHIETLVAGYSQAFRTTPEEDRLFDMVRAHIETLKDIAVPLAFRHIDFSPINVYRDGQSLTVIDWEDRSFDHDRFGPGLCDLFYFVTYWSFAAHGLHTEEAQIRNFWHLFLRLDSHGYSDNMVHRAIARYMQEQRIDRRLYPVLLVYSSIEHALERLNRQTLHGVSAANARSGNLYVHHVGNLAGHVEELFATPSAWEIIDANDSARQPVRV